MQAALGEIEKVHPELAAYLRKHVKRTGDSFTYDGEERFDTGFVSGGDVAATVFGAEKPKKIR